MKVRQAVIGSKTGLVLAGARFTHLLRAVLVCVLLPGGFISAQDRGRLMLDSIPYAQYRLEGYLGERISANSEQWLKTAPGANPAILELWKREARAGPGGVDPPAFGFAGQYLASAAPILRLLPDERLREVLEQFTSELMAAQTNEGYFGPVRESQAVAEPGLLWGHYALMVGLLKWHEAVNDPEALAAARRAGLFISQTFLATPESSRDGISELDLAVRHGLALIHRWTRDPQISAAFRQFEEESALWNVYLEGSAAGPDGGEPLFHPEDLAVINALPELFRVTGNERYRIAFMNHWRTLLERQRQPCGGLLAPPPRASRKPSHPPEAASVETCATVAWMALTLDYLKVTGDPAAADELELSTYNSIAAAQHPSGRWWSSNTPLNGSRTAAAQTRADQTAPGRPEFTCCSASGPRGLALIPEWAVMRTGEGLAVNFYGPGVFQGRLPDNTPVALRWVTGYPLNSGVEILVDPVAARRFELKLRIPAWSTKTVVRVNREPPQEITTAGYHRIQRRWRHRDRVRVDFNFDLRLVSHQDESLVYRGPILLSYDARFNALPSGELPDFTLAEVSRGKVHSGGPASEAVRSALPPWIAIEFTSGGRRVRLCDFGGAGAAGTEYRSALPIRSP